MAHTSARDFSVGLFVLAGFAAIAYLSFQVGSSVYSGPGGLVLHARFDETGGLSMRAPVVIGGVRVGRVIAIELDKDDFRARVTMDLDRTLRLPEDTSASILTQGVLGDRLISLQPGGEEALLTSGGEIAFTESAVVLEHLLGRFVTGFGDQDPS